MASIGDLGFFGFSYQSGVVARRCIVTGFTPGSAFGPGEPDRYKVCVFVSTNDDDMLEEAEKYTNQPTAGGYPIPRLPVERECMGESQSPTANGFWVP